MEFRFDSDLYLLVLEKNSFAVVAESFKPL